MEVVTRWPHKRGQTGDIKAIALTGFGTEQDVQRSKEAGFDFHLVKPINFQELQTVLDQSNCIASKNKRSCSQLSRIHCVDSLKLIVIECSNVRELHHA